MDPINTYFMKNFWGQYSLIGILYKSGPGHGPGPSEKSGFWTYRKGGSYAKIHCNG